MSSNGAGGAPGPGRVVILNGPPRSGKSSIAEQIQSRSAQVWIGLGVDAVQGMTPARYAPGIGLRPGGERPDLEELVVSLYRGLYASVAAYSRTGLNVVVDAAHHQDYSRELPIRHDAAVALAGLPVLFVGVHCPVSVALDRRRATWGGTGFTASDTLTDPVTRWHTAVHDPGRYDLVVDTGEHSAAGCAEQINHALHRAGPDSAFFDVAPAPSSP